MCIGNGNTASHRSANALSRFHAFLPGASPSFSSAWLRYGLAAFLECRPLLGATEKSWMSCQIQAWIVAVGVGMVLGAVGGVVPVGNGTIEEGRTSASAVAGKRRRRRRMEGTCIL